MLPGLWFFFFRFSWWSIEISVCSLYINFNNVSSCSFSSWFSYLRSSTYVIAQAIKGKQFLLLFRILEVLRKGAEGRLLCRSSEGVLCRKALLAGRTVFVWPVFCLHLGGIYFCDMLWHDLQVGTCHYSHVWNSKAEDCPDVLCSTWHHWDAKIRVLKKEI